MQAFEILKGGSQIQYGPYTPVEPSIWFLPKYQVLKRELWRALEVSILKNLCQYGDEKKLCYRIQQPSDGFKKLTTVQKVPVSRK
jgi:hypothetical protein